MNSLKAFGLGLIVASLCFLVPRLAISIKDGVDGYIDARVRTLVNERVRYVYEDLYTLYPDRVYWSRHGTPRVH